MLWIIFDNGTVRVNFCFVKLLCNYCKYMVLQTHCGPCFLYPVVTLFLQGQILDINQHYCKCSSVSQVANFQLRSLGKMLTACL